MPIFPSEVTGANPSGNDKHSNSKVPNAQRPRTRPPRELRDKLGILQASLPIYSGPYSVGMMDIEVPAADPRVFSHIKRDHHHLLKLETVLISIYYPSEFGSGSGRDPSGQKKWSRETWLPAPRLETTKGYAKFSGLPNSVIVPLFTGTTMFTKLPAFRNAAPAQHWPPEDNSKEAGSKVKNEAGPPPPGEPDEPTFPLMMFSHGLGGNRTVYSSLCGEFASYGHVVCAIEHRDGSGPRSCINRPQHGEVAPCVPEDQRKPLDRAITETPLARKKDKHRYVDYIFPKDNPRDTAPNGDGVDEELRSAQMQLRLAELDEAYRIMQLIADGKGEEVAANNLRKKGYIASSSRGLIGVDWNAWKGRFFTDRVTLLGHSFGAATTVQALRTPGRFKWVTQGVIYDIWGAPLSDIQPPTDLPPEAYDLALETDTPFPRPLLGISSEAFMFWERNFNIASRIIHGTHKLNNTPNWLLTVKGSIHVSQSDFSILYPKICTLVMKMTVNPKRAIDINVGATLEFLKRVDVADRTKIIQRTMRDEGFLDVPVTKEMPCDRSPAQKWTAVRLKIPHEFRSRVLPSVERKVRRAVPHSKSSKLRCGADPGNEVWVHSNTTDEELEEWRSRKGLPDPRKRPSDEVGDHSQKEKFVDHEDDPIMGGKSQSFSSVSGKGDESNGTRATSVGGSDKSRGKVS